MPKILVHDRNRLTHDEGGWLGQAAGRADHDRVLVVAGVVVVANVDVVDVVVVVVVVVVVISIVVVGIVYYKKSKKKEINSSGFFFFEIFCLEKRRGFEV